jgi:glutathione S-transferase
MPASAILVGVPGSHPTLGAELMLRRKGVAYRRFDLVAGVHRPLLRLIGFPGITVPAVSFADGVRIQGSRRLSRVLDVLYPDPPLFPPDGREEVERAEQWGDLVLQEVPRRIVWWGLRRRPEVVGTFLVDAKLGIPPSVALPLTGPVIVLAGRLNRATNAALERDLRALPGLLDHVDELISSGVIGGEEPNAADFQIATSLRLLMAFEDLRPVLEARPAGELAVRVVPRMPGNVPSVLPPEAVAQLR